MPLTLLRVVLLGSVAAALSACGGGIGSGTGSSSGSTGSGGTGGSSSSSSSSSSGSVAVSNVMQISVNLGPNGDYANGAFATITLCVPNSGSCTSVQNVLVDTGSYGLRLLASTVQNLALPALSNGTGLTTAECAVFADGYTWGPVVGADIELAGLVAHNVPINIVGSSSYAAVPAGCSAGAGQEEDTASALGANGILGIGPFQYDCGQACVQSAAPRQYWNCGTASGACSSTEQPLSGQVQNPVALFASDNNGVMVQLPSVNSAGTATASGTVTFGIGTRSNNGLGSAKIIASDDVGNFSTSFNNTSYPDSFIDSGSNGYFFHDANLPDCSQATGFYCPSSTQSLSAVMTGANNVQATVPFMVANAETLFTNNNGNNAAFNDLAGDTGSTLDGSFDWGLSFFFGRKVFFAIQDMSTPQGTGPYYAF